MWPKSDFTVLDKGKKNGTGTNLFSQERDQLVVENLRRLLEVRRRFLRVRLLPLLPSLVQPVQRHRPLHPLDEARPDAERNDRVVPRAIIVTALLHERVGDGQELHDALVQVKVLQAFEQVGVLLAIAAGLESIFKTRL